MFLRRCRSLPLLWRVVLLAAAVAAHALGQARARPNIVYMLADDLGWGELGCYGQGKIRTPNVDRLAAEGMRFTQHYAGAPVCAPSRCVLLTGVASPHAWIRGNREVKPEGQLAIPDEAVTIAELLRDLGYRTGCVGKWGLGSPGSSGDPVVQGFDLFFGYNCQRQAHNYYPTHLWRNDDKLVLDNPSFAAHQRLDEPPESYASFHGVDYAPDAMLEAALEFVRENEGGPFFLYLPFVEPHLAMQPPLEWVDRYPAEWDDRPYLGERGYLPHPRPRAGYAAMISDLDEHVGSVLAVLDELGLTDDTAVFFSSDNGATHDVGGVETEFFESTGPLRGRKGSVYEGGLRVPLVVRWPGVVEAGATSRHVSAFRDVLPTLLEIAGGSGSPDLEGISFLPTLRGASDQPTHAMLVWEFHGYGGQQALRAGRWKAVRQGLHRGNEVIELYDLAADPGETTDVAAEHPELVARFDTVLRTERTPNPDFPIELLDR